MKYLKNPLDWVKKNRNEFIWLVVILAIGSFLRLFRIGEYMTFLGDEGRDAIVVRNLLVKFDPILIGPRTSIGDMYLGPLYYYLIAPSLFLANYSPIGPSILVALIGIATIFLLWLVVKQILGEVPARVSAFLYAISPVVVKYSASSWNPNIMPFFALLMVYCLWKVWQSKKYFWMIVGMICFAFVLNSHYLGLLLLPTIGLGLLVSFKSVYKTKKRSGFIKYFIISSGIFLFLMSPIVIFDARHGWRNMLSMKKFFTERQTTVSARPWSGFTKIYPIFQNDYVTRIISGSNIQVGKYTSFVLSGFLIIYTLVNYKKMVKIIKKDQTGKKQDIAFFMILASWMIFSFLGMSLYKQHIYDHYFGFVYPAGFILFAYFYKKTQDILGDSGKVVTATLVLLITGANIIQSPLRYAPNRQMQRAVAVAEKIKSESRGEKMNLAVIAERNYEDGYQYFLEKDGALVSKIDPQIPASVASQLFVVCEMSFDKCDPVNNPKAEIANFGWSKIENVWVIEGVTVYKLVHTQ